ncbi:hypothetical protein B0H12DRAFT_1237731 [Mycena haematopus]|nr:hypothetical protein B0H12DRAFT_1237731 [Mycena haematopus]
MPTEDVGVGKDDRHRATQPLEGQQYSLQLEEQEGLEMCEHEMVESEPVDRTTSKSQCDMSRRRAEIHVLLDSLVVDVPSAPLVVAGPEQHARVVASTDEQPAEEVEEDADKSPATAEPRELTASQLSRLEHVPERGSLYSSILQQQIDDPRERHAAERAANAKSKLKEHKSSKGKGRATKRRRRAEPEPDAEDPAAFPQPALIAGGRLKDYQLEGL